MEIIDKLVKGFKGNTIIGIIMIIALLYLSFMLESPKKASALPSKIGDTIGDSIEKFIRWIDRL